MLTSDLFENKTPATMNEGAVKELSQDLKSMSDKEFLIRYKMTKAQARSAMKSDMAEGLNEFAPPGSSDGGDDGFSEDTLKRLAAQWWNGDEDPRVESTLMAAGWEIGQDEGYDNGGVFVVMAGDENGKTYLSWPAEELQGLTEGLDQPKEASKAIQSLKNLAVMKSALTMQQLSQAGREAIVSNAINAAKTLEQSYLQNKQQGNAIFVRALRDEIDNFMRGAPINASFSETDTASELGDLLQGKLGKVNFQQGVAEAEKNPHTSALGKALYRDLSKEKKASPAQVQRNKERWAQRQSEREQGVAEGLGNIGNKIKSVYQKIHNAGDDAVEFMYYDSPIFAHYWEEYEGDLDSIIAEVDPSELEIILSELESAAEDQGVAEGAFDNYSPMAQQQIAKDKNQALKNTSADEVIRDLIQGSLDGYDVMAHPRTPAQKVVSKMMQEKYDDIAINHRLHPDDDFEEIISRVIDDFEEDYGAGLTEEQDLAEAVGTLELADFLFKGLEQKFPKVVERYGHEVVGDAIMDVAEENQDVNSVSDVDMLIDDIIEKLQNYSGNNSGLAESAVSRLYYNVVGTSGPELRKDFGMRRDSCGWFLSESSGRSRIMDAHRAFGSPKLVEYDLTGDGGGAATLGPDNVISPIGTVPRGQQLNKKTKSKKV